MQKSGFLVLLLIIIVVIVGVFYFDVFDHTYSKDKAIASIIHLEDIRLASGQLLEYLEDRNYEVRAEASLAVGRIGDAGPAERLFGMLNDSIAEVNEQAAFALGITREREFATELLDQAELYPPGLRAFMFASRPPTPSGGAAGGNTRVNLSKSAGMIRSARCRWRRFMPW
jgi:hypothetical protein